jgi:hypothetical protein
MRYLSPYSSEIIPSLYSHHKTSTNNLQLLLLLEKKNYVQAAKELPKIADHEVDQRAREFGFVSSDDESPVAKDRQSRDVEKQEGINTNPGGLAA